MMRYYRRLFFQVIANSTASMLAYRSNVIFFFLFESLFTIANLGGILLGVDFAGGQLADWTLNQVMFVTSLYGIGHQLFVMFCMGGLFNTGWFVWNGRMDYVLLKPLHPLLGMHATNEFVVSNTPNLLINSGIFVFFCQKVAAEGATFGFANTLGMILFFFAGMAVRYGLALLVVTPAFFAEKLAEGEESYWSIQSLSKYPSGVFPRVMQWIFTFLLPVASIAAIPANVFFGRLNLGQMALHLSVALFFSWCTIKFYEFGAKHYQSVNTGA